MFTGVQELGSKKWLTFSEVEECFPATGLKQKINPQQKSESIHDGPGLVMRPGCGVIRQPKTGIDLGNDDLVFGRPLFVDLFTQQGGGVNAVSADLDFPCAVTRDERVAVNGSFQL